MKIGDIIKYKDTSLKVVKDTYNTCEGCFFRENHINCIAEHIPECHPKHIMFVEFKSITLKQLIDKLTNISRRLSSCEIPIIYNGVNNNITDVNLSLDNNDNYYVNII